jgi:hypothetical protein
MQLSWIAMASYETRYNETSFKTSVGTHFWMPIEDSLFDQFVYLPRLH